MDPISKRFWRDMGYVFGGLIAGLSADALGYGGAIALVAALTAASAFWALLDMPPKPLATGRPHPLEPPDAEPAVEAALLKRQ